MVFEGQGEVMVCVGEGMVVGAWMMLLLEDGCEVVVTVDKMVCTVQYLAEMVKDK